ncbi:MAG: hypothetical protein C0621_11205 [Desulfuromonas sp.]|nr:MAG: hypothetical protein C0621_11205 [Desulfuromonas sp.]
MKPKIKGQKGFTLIELMVALTIFAIGLLSVANMQIMSLRTNSVSDSLSTSSDLAQGILEEILAWDPDRPEMQSSAVDVVWDFDPETSTVESLLSIDSDGNLVSSATEGTFSATYSVSADYNGINELNRIVVTVTPAHGRHKPVTLVAFKSRGVPWRGNL